MLLPKEWNSSVNGKYDYFTQESLKPNPRILIVTGSAGGGHVSAASALEAEAVAGGFECLSVDALKASSLCRYSTCGIYDVLVRYFPWVWAAFYRFLDRYKAPLKIHIRLSMANLTRLDTVIADFRPTWIICTHNVGLQRLALLRRKPHGFRLAVALTDIYPHSIWVVGCEQAGAEMIFVPTAESKANILSRTSISAEKIVVTGIPICPAFSNRTPIDQETTRHITPTILITSGMIGAGRFQTVLEALSRLDLKVRFVCVCGANGHAYRRLSQTATTLFRTTPHEYDICGQLTRNAMADLLCKCTLLVGKPGGLTMSESMAAGCPFIIYTPFQIPGQEEKNADFLVDRGIGIRAKNPDELLDTVRCLLASRERLDQMRMNALANAKPNAAKEIMQLIAMSCTEPALI